MHPFIMYQEAKDRQKDFQRDAEKHRLLRLARTGRPSAMTSFRQLAGKVLIKVGSRLKDLSNPGTPSTLKWADR